MPYSSDHNAISISTISNTPFSMKKEKNNSSFIYFCISSIYLLLCFVFVTDTIPQKTELQ